jgi:diadenosine tetraphosphatase ApaH/serine/threonine PP2A family protein phosphatase
MGNHDWAVLGRPGVNVDDFNPHARQAVMWTREQLEEENRRYLDALPDRPVRPVETGDFLLTHASPREPVWEYILTPSIAMENFGVFGESICLVGHTHKPAIYRWRLPETGEPPYTSDSPTVGRHPATVDCLQLHPGTTVHLATSASQRLIINPGSVGQPRDNDARAAYAIFDVDALTWQYERIPYPIELTQGEMRAAGLPKRLIDRLSFGW